MINKIIYFFVLGLLLVGCGKEYLDLVPEKDITTIESTFEKRIDALKFQAGCYQGTISGRGTVITDPALTGADEFMTGKFCKSLSHSRAGETYIPGFEIAEGNQNTSFAYLPIWGSDPLQSEWSNRYELIRLCNIYIDHVDDVYNMPDEEKKRTKAEIKAVKAVYYFELIKYYGPIVLVDENTDPDADTKDMLLPRMHIDTCIKAVVDLFDEAVPFLDNINNKTNARIAYISKEAALSYKAKALLYAASPLFNGNVWYANMTSNTGDPLFSSSYDESKWLRAAKAMDEAVEACESAGLYLDTGVSDRKSEKLNVIRDIQNSTIIRSYQSPEMIFGVGEIKGFDYQSKIPRHKPQSSSYSGNIYGVLNPTLRMVESFYTENGLPIDQDQSWDYNKRYKMGIETSQEWADVVKLNSDVVNLHLKREPRFYANIAADKTFWEDAFGGMMEIEPYKGDEHGNISDYIIDGDVQHRTGYWCKKMVIREGVNNPSPELSFDKLIFPAIRLADLYLMQAEAWNEVGGNNSKVYDAVNKVRDRAGIPSLQNSWSLAKDPSKVSTQVGLREIIRQERTIELAFEGHRFWDLRRWKTAHDSQNTPLKGWNVFASDAEGF